MIISHFPRGDAPAAFAVFTLPLAIFAGLTEIWLRVCAVALPAAGAMGLALLLRHGIPAATPAQRVGLNDLLPHPARTSLIRFALSAGIGMNLLRRLSTVSATSFRKADTSSSRSLMRRSLRSTR